MATAIFDFYPYACPQCATPFKLDERDYLSGAPHTCNCGLHFRYDKKAINNPVEPYSYVDLERQDHENYEREG